MLHYSLLRISSTRGSRKCVKGNSAKLGNDGVRRHGGIAQLLSTFDVPMGAEPSRVLRNGLLKTDLNALFTDSQVSFQLHFWGKVPEIF